ncbi:peptide/nickel transport system ATP-binding protein [Frondihabitans sp. PhB188]|uniref:ATP-binding cassette domain-containing protein n=1 Tax=Frondihabitans sp. PhB188 TaxID=2485200 RepID=UPI000F471F52|nr:ATP-binding cassette domain-containing protein [Frondihabitans sp. PhB188]ROQ39395.1 peptide/nickel transport system ATP-binding protein [Frondihabitans sp. PhB188]
MYDQHGDTPLLQVDDLVVEYPGRRRGTPFKAVDHVSFHIGRGQTLGLVGESGSGKSTIARAIQGLVPATSGSINVNGIPITTERLADRRSLAKVVQTVFQDPYGSLNPVKSVGSIIEEGLLVQQGTLSAAARTELVGDELDRVGLPRTAASKRPGELSGGQRQRVAIARAVITRPALVICDEAVSAMDLSVQAQVLNLLADLQHDLGVSYLFITHDLAVVRHITTQVAVLEHGRIVDLLDGDTHQEQWDPYTKKLFDAVPIPDPDIQLAKRATYAKSQSSTPPLTAS